MLNLLIVWLVTAVSLFIMSRLPLGIEIDDFGTAVVAALVLGVLNALLRPLLGLLAFPLTVITFGLFALVLNAIVFALAASLLKGFEVKGCLSALIGPIVLTLLNALFFAILH